MKFCYVSTMISYCFKIRQQCKCIHITKYVVLTEVAHFIALTAL